jgi:hypothetical protein
VLEAGEELVVEVRRVCVVGEGQRGAVVLGVGGVAAVRRVRRNGIVAAARDAAPRVASADTASLRHAAQR